MSALIVMGDFRPDIFVVTDEAMCPGRSALDRNAATGRRNRSRVVATGTLPAPEFEVTSPKIAAVVLIIIVVAGGYWYGRGGVGAPSGFVEIEVPPTRFLEVTRSGNGDWEPFVEPSSGFTGFRLSKGVSRQVTVRLHDLNQQGETSEHDVGLGGYVVTGHQRIRIFLGAT